VVNKSENISLKEPRLAAFFMLNIFISDHCYLKFNDQLIPK